MGHLSKPAAAVGVAALLLAGTGAYAVASSGGGTISACVRGHGGTLYQAKNCAKHDKRLTWNKTGPAGPRGDTGPRGPQGVPGTQGPAGPTTTTLPSGQTLRGWFNLDTVAAAANQFNGGSISFSLHLATAPTVVVIPVGGPTTVQCSGSVANPTAAAGFMCIYESSTSNVTSFLICSATTCSTTTPTADTFGAETFTESTNTGRFYLDGTWAVTAA